MRRRYVTPTMAEAAANRGTNGLTLVSTFSGCGGSCLGFELAGFEVLWASEFLPVAREVYEINHPGVPVDPRDIREVKAEDVLRAIGGREVDVLEGSPPCASFSMAGTRSAKWGEEKTYSETRQRTDDLFFEFARLLEGIKPRAFVAENVVGITIGKARGYFNEIHRALSGAGYRVEARMVNAARLGVPQTRQRVIFLGVREDLPLRPAFPNPSSSVYTLDDAIPWLRPGSTTRVHKIEEAAWLDRYEIGREWHRMRIGEQSARYFQLIRCDPRKPAPTITARGGGEGVAGPCHPLEPRKFSIEEVKRLCAFPDDFKLTGTYVQQWERLGRSVPPLMMREIANGLRQILTKGGISDGV